MNSHIIVMRFRLFREPIVVSQCEGRGAGHYGPARAKSAHKIQG